MLFSSDTNARLLHGLCYSLLAMNRRFLQACRVAGPLQHALPDRSLNKHATLGQGGGGGGGAVQPLRYCLTEMMQVQKLVCHLTETTETISQNCTVSYHAAATSHNMRGGADLVRG